MPIGTINGIRLNYQDTGSGEPVLMVMGTGSGGRVWHLHQVPALVAAGFRVITFDNRGIEPTDTCAGGITVDDMAGDVIGLIEHLGLAPCRIVGTSMGAHVVQEVALAKPGLVRQCVLMATRGRTDVLRAAMAEAEIALHDSGVAVPARYRAVVRAVQNLSPRTLNDDSSIADWLDVFELTDTGGSPGVRAQLDLDVMPDRLAAYRSITADTHVIAFADDLVTPPEYGREVADAIPGATFSLIPDCGHYGYLEQPDEVNRLLLDHFAPR
ncbi:alpha/beta fold hydrolase [Streptomyces armeniacus]|uniref:Alpha/beta fold hydrolase n=1 Tax=Streptomyces armeniacus TaxID=83291 RepID=A0A345XM25_9ACTN|nr:alpha/beta fold hydrolase [Streptomyces armeniacus]AXK32691.1 alpha/beta fold hydrolase [Streptomyces armeniacus]